MSKRTLLILNLIFILLSLILDLILGIIYKFDIRFYYASLFTTMGIGLGNLFFILLGFSVVKGYDITTYQLAREASYIVIAVGAYYLVKYVNHYDEFAYLYWILTCLLIIGMFILFIYLDKKNKLKNDKKPRIVPNIKK